ncbi:efflux RND transporter periplasmic adaptor subunit, partial [Paracoccus shandongensis]|uniref:efflux RND transporter periplasmic adaptor subunit n=1 Tax=Paracoccus shandongensis TaxID=2816048 RepID=UPI001A8DF952
ANARAQAASAADGLAVARAALAQAEAARRIADLNLNRAAITAPVAGTVVARSAELGALAGAATDPLFTLLADGAVEMSAEVIETALASLKVGDPAEITVAGAGPVAGQVRLVPASVDPVTRLGVMRIAMDKAAGVRTGQFASGWVITDRRQAVTVPASAVLADDAGERVQVVKDGRVETRPVRAGLLWNGRREITEGLAPGEPVITRSGAFFRTGDQVRPVAAEGAGP